MDGAEDQIKQHRSKLVGGTLQEGEFPNVNFDPAPKLTSSAWYNVTFNGTDRAGNSSSYLMGRIYFDNVPPKVSGLYPSTGSFVNLAEILSLIHISEPTRPY